MEYTIFHDMLLLFLWSLFYFSIFFLMYEWRISKLLKIHPIIHGTIAGILTHIIVFGWDAIEGSISGLARLWLGYFLFMAPILFFPVASFLISLAILPRWKMFHFSGIREIVFFTMIALHYLLWYARFEI